MSFRFRKAINDSNDSNIRETMKVKKTRGTKETHAQNKWLNRHIETRSYPMACAILIALVRS
jgi:hypothetical protein